MPTPTDRYSDELIKSWSVAATYGKRFALLGRKLAVMVEGDATNTSVTVNVIDKCANRDCGGCCRRNSGRKTWQLLDLEKWPASQLLGFDPTPADFDINEVVSPSAAGLRRKAPESDVMPLCYKDVGPADALF